MKTCIELTYYFNEERTSPSCMHRPHTITVVVIVVLLHSEEETAFRFSLLFIQPNRVNIEIRDKRARNSPSEADPSSALGEFMGAASSVNLSNGQKRRIEWRNGGLIHCCRQQLRCRHCQSMIQSPTAHMLNWLIFYYKQNIRNLLLEDR